MLGSFLPPAPTPSLTTHSVPSLSPLPPQDPAEIILPLEIRIFKHLQTKECKMTPHHGVILPFPFYLYLINYKFTLHISHIGM
jgi:hypothetical protein